jgi:hyperosmotically inducible periplasmic protein
MSMRLLIMTTTALLAAATFAVAPALAAEDKGAMEGAKDKAKETTEKATEKVKETTEKATDKAKETTHEAKTQVTDSWITSKTKIALFGDDRVKGTQVKVETMKGVVTLRGKVDSDEAKSAAAEVAKGIDGVKSVKNDLQVVAPKERKAVAANDKDITARVEQSLKKDASLKKIHARTDAGVVTLTGEAPSITASARASELARGVAGVHAVKNEVQLNAKMSRSAAPRT